MSTESSAVEAASVQADEVVKVDGVVNEQDKGGLETGKTADPPVAEDVGVKGPATALEAVKAALKAEPTADSPPAGKEPLKSVVDGAVEKATPEAQVEADKLLPFANHPRWKEVYTARQAAEAAVTEMTPKAQRWDALDAEFRKTGLSGEDVQPLFDGGVILKRAGVTHDEVGSLMKVGAALKIGDREVLRQIAGPIFESLGLQLVEKLSPEIQAMIDEGAISEDAGRKMSGLHFEKAATTARLAIAEGRETTRTQEETAVQQAARFERASASWESRVKPADADWSRKEPFIVDAIKARLSRKAPTTEREVEAICQESYDQVTRIMKGSATTRAAVRPAVGGASSTAKAAPKTALEAVKAGLGER